MVHLEKMLQAVLLSFLSVVFLFGMELASFGGIIDFNNNGVPDNDEATFSICQVSIQNPDGTIATPNLNAFFAEVTLISPPPETILWFNMNVGGFSGEKFWEIQNLPIIGLELPGRPMTIRSPLAKLADAPPGAIIGTTRSGIRISQDPLSSSGSIGNEEDVTVKHVVYNEGNERDAGDPGATAVQLEPRSLINAVNQDPWKAVSRLGVPGVSEERGFCSPGSYARCFGWLNETYCLGFPEECDTPQEMYEILKNADHMDTNQAGSIAYDDTTRRSPVVDAATKFKDDKGFLFLLDVEWKHRNNEVEPLNPDEILNALEIGKDVIMSWGRYRETTGGINMGEEVRIGGHAVTVVGAAACGGNLDYTDDTFTIYYRDDNTGQGDGVSDAGYKAQTLTFDEASNRWEITGRTEGETVVLEAFTIICPDMNAGFSGAKKTFPKVSKTIGDLAQAGTITNIEFDDLMPLLCDSESQITVAVNGAVVSGISEECILIALNLSAETRLLKKDAFKLVERNANIPEILNGMKDRLAGIEEGLNTLLREFNFIDNGTTEELFEMLETDPFSPLRLFDFSRYWKSGGGKVFR